MVGADITELNEYEDDMEKRYLILLANQKRAHELEVGDLKGQMKVLEDQFLALLPFCVRAFSLLSAADEHMGDLSLKGPTPAFITQTNIRLWLQEFHTHVKEYASEDGQVDSSGTDLEA